MGAPARCVVQTMKRDEYDRLSPDEELHEQVTAMQSGKTVSLLGTLPPSLGPVS